MFLTSLEMYFCCSLVNIQTTLVSLKFEVPLTLKQMVCSVAFWSD
uniref:Uncharacterized protein n=1 Tax=Anguilla anguilla TaxID=7936 RepID=A0A0E9WQS1_ANGAN